MNTLYVSTERLCIELRMCTANEAGILQNLFLLLFFTSQVGKCVNDDTKDEVQHNNNDNEEEQKVIHNSSNKERLLRE